MEGDWEGGAACIGREESEDLARRSVVSKEVSCIKRSQEKRRKLKRRRNEELARRRRVLTVNAMGRVFELPTSTTAF